MSADSKAPVKGVISSMPQLVQGGKWVYGWVILSLHRTFRIPPQAFEEYGFQAGQPVAFLRGSGLALGFLAKGPIYKEALKHPEIETFLEKELKLIRKQCWESPKQE